MNDEPLEPLPTLAMGRYRHYKGGLYDVLGVVRHSETLEALVLYRSLKDPSSLWVRPYGMFTEQGHFEGRLQPRFSWQSPDAPPQEG
jgi:hypothetical protein